MHHSVDVFALGAANEAVAADEEKAEHTKADPLGKTPATQSPAIDKPTRNVQADSNAAASADGQGATEQTTVTAQDVKPETETEASHIGKDAAAVGTAVQNKLDAAVPMDADHS